MFQPPSFHECLDITIVNSAFTHTVEEIDGFKLHNFGYRLPGYMDFTDPMLYEHRQDDRRNIAFGMGNNNPDAYVGNGKPTFDAFELRGLTFLESPDGTVQRFLMLHKFHCLNQTMGSMYADVKDKSIATVTDKRDGSLIRFIKLPNDRLIAKSKGSFSGPHCEMALELLKANHDLYEFVLWCQEASYAAIFELTGPMNEVVLKYNQPELRLIQVRDEITGDYQDYQYEFNHVGERVLELNIPVVDFVHVNTLDELIALQNTTKNLEGWVIRFTDGTMIKVKTNWYEDMHRHVIEKQRTDKTFIEMTINETMDDALGLMPIGDPIRVRMEEVMTKISRHFNHTVSDVINTVSTFDGDKSAFAAKHKTSPNFGIYMFAISKNAGEKDIEGHVKRTILSSCKTEKDATRFIASL